MKPTHKGTKQSAKGPTATGKAFTEEERGAIRDRVQEMKAGKGEGESEVLAKIAEMPKRLHTIIRESSPALSPRLWYGMPAYAKDGKVVCFFQAAQKFKTRYATFGFSDKANLDEGNMWPTTFALKALTAAEQARITALVKKAVS